MVGESCVPPVRTGHFEEGDAGDRRVSFPQGEDPQPSARFLFCMPRTMVGHGLKCSAKLSVCWPLGAVSGSPSATTQGGWSEGTLILPMGAS